MFNSKSQLPQDQKSSRIHKKCNSHYGWNQRELNTFAATARLHGNVLVGGPEKSAGAMVTGVVPEDEIPITKADQQIIEGKYLSTEDSTGVIVGITLYEDLDIKLQDELFLFTQGSDGSMAYGLYNVVGVYRSGSTLKDRGIFDELPAYKRCDYGRSSP